MRKWLLITGLLALAVGLLWIGQGLGPVDTYRIHKMMAARVTTA
jgi:hypothetical protein